MTQLLMAAALFVLAAARVPALRRNGSDTVFLAAVFAGASSLLLNPAIYMAADSALGGINLAKLALNSFMIVGLWFLRNAVLSAIAPEADTRSPWVRRMPLIITLALQTVFFALTGPTVSTTTWGTDYHHLLPAALFSAMMIIFIAWSCGEIAWKCLRYVPRMRRSFKVGFSMVGLGSLISVVVMGKMIQEAFSGFITPLQSFGVQNFPFAAAEMLAIMLVGVGLTIPAVAGRSERKQSALRLDRTVAKVAAIRERALNNADLERILKTDEGATPQERMHRMIVEIWDAELAAGTGKTVLTSEDRAYLLLVESDFELEKTH
jgi:hypothetical protein